MRDASSRAHFNPPAPCGTGPVQSALSCFTSIFQSTRPLRGGTSGSVRYHRHEHISIHPPLAGRDARGLLPRARRRISIHPPLAGRDLQPCTGRHRKEYFNPPAPCGAGPCCGRCRLTAAYFNPPAPCGAGQVGFSRVREQVIFQSTRPLWGRTTRTKIGKGTKQISIHPPLVGRDRRLRHSRCRR